MGFIFAARLAGDEPKITPVKIETITEIIIAGIDGEVTILIVSATSGSIPFTIVFAISPSR